MVMDPKSSPRDGGFDGIELALMVEEGIKIKWKGNKRKKKRKKTLVISTRGSTGSLPSRQATCPSMSDMGMHAAGGAPARSAGMHLQAYTQAVCSGRRKGSTRDNT